MKNRSRMVNLLVMSVTAITMTAVFADNRAEKGLMIGRYSVALPRATPAQADLLSAVVIVEFPQTVVTIGNAVDHILMRSGYRMASLESADPHVGLLVNQPLPAVQRKLGPMTLSEALDVLAGPAFRLVVDHLNRLVSFEVTEKYRKLAGAEPTPPIQQRSGASSNIQGAVALTASATGVMSMVDSAVTVGTSAAEMINVTAQSNELHLQFYGPVRAGEDLTQIVKHWKRENDGSTIEQFMLAVVQYNPMSFEEGSINWVKEGTTLRYPPPTITAQIPPPEAAAEVQRQLRKWQSESDDVMARGI